MNVQSEFQKLQSTVENEIQRLKDIADAQIQPPKQLIKYTEPRHGFCTKRNNFGEANLRVNAYFFSISGREPSVIKEEYLNKVLAQWDHGVEQWKVENQQAYLDNQEVIAHNTLQYQRVQLIMETLGVKRVNTKAYFKTPRSIKMTTEKTNAAWSSEVSSVLPMDCGYQAQIKAFDKKRDEIKNYGEKKIKEHTEQLRKEKLESDKLEKEQNKIKTIAYLAAKYNMGVNYDEDTVLDVLLSKCKYLKLAHYLRKNERDWSDGYHYARIGLDSFTVESAEDKEIQNEIKFILMDEDDIDGRYFLDADYNYNVVFDMVPEYLLTDYNSLMLVTDES